MKKRIIVSVDAGETRVAVLESKGAAKGGSKQGRDGAENDRNGRKRGGGDTQRGNWKVGELYVERKGSRSIVGNIYKGVVDNVLPGMEAAFVDIGLERNGFLHVDEIVLPDGQKVPRRGHGKGRRIDELIKPKQEVLVQVVKDPLKTKGARLSMQLSIAGRYLVYMPQGGGRGRQPPPLRQGARPPAQAAAEAAQGRRRRDRADRRAGRDEGRLRARPGVSASAARGGRQARGRGQGARAGRSRRRTCRSGSCATSSPRSSTEP